MSNIIAAHKNQGRPSPSPEKDAPILSPYFSTLVNRIRTFAPLR